MTDTIIQWNIRGFRSNREDLLSLLDIGNIKCVALQETMLNEELTCTVRRHKVYRKDVNSDTRATGGVALVIPESIPSREIPISSPLQAVAAQIADGTLLTVCSLYIPPHANINFRDLENLVEQLPVPFFLLGDFNAHSNIWGGNETDSRGRIVERLLEDLDLSLLNDGSPTYHHAPTRSFSAIDLSFSTPSLTSQWSWSVITDPLGSDHFPIFIKKEHVANANGIFPRRWKIEQADWLLYSETAVISTDMVEIADINEAVKEITSCITLAAEASIPMTSGRLPPRPKPWWNEDCQRAKRKQKAAWNRFRRYPTAQNQILFLQARAAARRVRRKAQRDSWHNYVSSINSSTSSKIVWNKIKRMKGNNSHMMSILTDNGIPLSSFHDMANLLAEHFSSVSSSTSYSPTFIRIRETAEQNAISFRPFTPGGYNCEFTEFELLKALHHTKNSAPGLDNIHYAMLRNLPCTSLCNLLRLYNRIWSSRVFPNSWRHAIVLAFPKPGKDASLPSSYRPIALTSCMCKVMERMVNERLVYFLESNSCLSPYQSGYRKTRSTLCNLLKLETSIREAFVRREHLVAVFFDIEKAYDKTWRYGILKDLYNTGLRGNLPYFIHNFLENRTFQVRFGNSLSNTFIQEQGVPQGAILSVTLFIFKLNNILNQLPFSVEGSLYVDDLMIFCRSQNMNFIERQIQTALNKIYNWANNNGFKFSIEKTKCIHFCRKRNLHLDPELTLNSYSLPISNEIKYLGVIFDRKLTFESHVKDLRKRCTKALNVIKVLSSINWGSDRDCLLRVYRSVIRSKLDYAGIIYGSARPSVLRHLDTVHHQALRLCIGAFRTSPVQSLYVVANEPSLKHRRSYLSLNHYVKLLGNRNNPYRSSIAQPRLGNFFQARPSAVPTFGLRMEKLMVEIGLPFQKDSILPSELYLVPPWRQNPPSTCLDLAVLNKSVTPEALYTNLFACHRHNNHDFKSIYTDGSKTITHVGCAFVCGDSVIAQKLPVYTSIFTAELYAIVLALDFIIKQKHKKYIIYSDSQSVLKALSSYQESSHTIVRQIKWQLVNLHSKDYDISFYWVPSHIGIKGNEDADAAAKSAVTISSLLLRIPHCDFRGVIRAALLQQWQTLWDGMAINKLHAIQPHITDGAHSQLNRKRDVIITRLRIGHTRLTHMYLLRGEPAPQCQNCGDTLTILHLFSCSHLLQQRLLYFHDSNLHFKDIINKSSLFNNIFDYLRAIGALASI